VANAQYDVGKWINKGLGKTGKCKKPSASIYSEIYEAYPEFCIFVAEFEFRFGDFLLVIVKNVRLVLNIHHKSERS
jgi:hypothetical protein